MNDAVVEFGEFCLVPAVGCSDEIACYTLQAVDGMAAAVGACLEFGRCVFITAVHASVAGVVDRAVADVILVHEVYNRGNGVGIVGCVAVDFHIENVSAAGQGMVGCFYFGFVAWRAVVVDGYMVGVGVVDFVGYTGNVAECLAVFGRELAGETFGRCGKNGEVVLVALAEIVHAATHVANNPQTEGLCFFAFAVMFADEGDEAFGKADEADTECALVDYRLDGVFGGESTAAVPQLRHKQGELFCESCLLEVESVVELTGCYFEYVVELAEEVVDAFVAVLDGHALDGKTHKIDSRERKIASSDRGLLAEMVFEHSCAATHCRNLVEIAFGVVGAPFIVVIEGGVEVYEVGEEAACGHFAGQTVEVVVGVFGQVAYAAFFLPYLNREDGGSAVAYTFVCRVEEFADNAASFGRCVGSVVDGTEYNLIAAAAVDSVHVVYERFHGLMHAGHSSVHGMLQESLVSLKAFDRLVEVVVELHVFHFAEVSTGQFFEILDFFDERRANKGCQIEIECRNCLASMHFILGGFERYAGDDTCGFYALCGARLAMAGNETVVEDIVEGMLYTGEAFGRVVVFVVYVYVVVAHGVASLGCEQIVVYEWFCSLAGELHHHACGRIGVHVRIFAGDVVVFCLDDFMEHVAGLGLSGNAALVAIGDIALGNFLSGAVHEFELHHVLNVFYGHALVAFGTDAVGYFLNQSLVFAKLGSEHGFSDCRLDFFFVITHDATVAFDYYLYHRLFLVCIVRFDISKEP